MLQRWQRFGSLCAEWRSALRDRRFPPIAAKELASLRCTVSLLCAFEKASDWTDWAVGTHGLIVEFTGASSAAAVPVSCVKCFYLSCSLFAVESHTCY